MTFIEKKSGQYLVEQVQRVVQIGFVCMTHPRKYK